MSSTTDKLIQELQQAIETARSIPSESGHFSWHPASEVPSDDKYYIVHTKSGAVYVSQPINGRWMSQIKSWMNLPQAPN